MKKSILILLFFLAVSNSFSQKLIEYDSTTYSIILRGLKGENLTTKRRDKFDLRIAFDFSSSYVEVNILTNEDGICMIKSDSSVVITLTNNKVLTLPSFESLNASLNFSFWANQNEFKSLSESTIKSINLKLFDRDSVYKRLSNQAKKNVDEGKLEIIQLDKQNTMTLQLNEVSQEKLQKAFELYWKWTQIKSQFAMGKITEEELNKFKQEHIIVAKKKGT